MDETRESLEAPGQDALEARLLGYLFGTLEGEALEALEEELLHSQEVLLAFLALKRAVEAGELHEQARPSRQARERLHAAVAERFGGRRRRSTGRWWARPIPLYQGLFVLGGLLLLFAASWWAFPRGTGHESSHKLQPPHQGPLIDTASKGKEALDWM